MLSTEDFRTGFCAIPNIDAPDVQTRVEGLFKYSLYKVFSTFFSRKLASDAVTNLSRPDWTDFYTNATEMWKYFTFSLWIYRQLILTDIGTVRIESETGTKQFDRDKYAEAYNLAADASFVFSDWLKTFDLVSDFDKQNHAKRLRNYIHY